MGHFIKKLNEEVQYKIVSNLIAMIIKVTRKTFKEEKNCHLHQVQPLHQRSDLSFLNQLKHEPDLEQLKAGINLLKKN